MIEAKQTCSIVQKFILKCSEHVYINELKNRSEETQLIVLKYIWKCSKHVYIKELNN